MPCTGPDRVFHCSVGATFLVHLSDTLLFFGPSRESTWFSLCLFEIERRFVLKLILPHLMPPIVLLARSVIFWHWFDTKPLQQKRDQFPYLKNCFEEISNNLENCVFRTLEHDQKLFISLCISKNSSNSHILFPQEPRGEPPLRGTKNIHLPKFCV